MTCVVAVAKDGVVYIGADSCGSTPTSAMVVTNPKVFIVDTRFIIGVCASFRAIDLLQHSLKVPKQPSAQSDDAFMRTIFITAVRETFSKNGFPRMDSDDEVSFLVGYRGKVYCVEDDYSVINPLEWGHSIGSGAEAARGSLWTSQESPDVTARIMVALQASEAMTPSVRGPFTVEQLPKYKRKETVEQRLARKAEMADAKVASGEFEKSLGEMSDEESNQALYGDTD